MYCIALYCIALQFIALQYIALQFIALHFIALYCVVLSIACSVQRRWAMLEQAAGVQLGAVPRSHAAAS